MAKKVTILWVAAALSISFMESCAWNWMVAERGLADRFSQAGQDMRIIELVAQAVELGQYLQATGIGIIPRPFRP